MSRSEIYRKALLIVAKSDVPDDEKAPILLEMAALVSLYDIGKREHNANV